MSLKVINFGCRLNSYESEVIQEKAEKAGLKSTIIFNSCSVTNEAERQLRQAIRREKRQHPEASIIVTGCAAQTNAQSYTEMNEVDFVLGNMEKLNETIYAEIRGKQQNSTEHNAAKIEADINVDLLPPSLNVASEKMIISDIMQIKEISPHLINGFESKVRAFMQVQNGCNHRCTFCIIPYGRGNSRSVTLGDIVKQTHVLVENGYREIVLTGVDITDYGLDLPGKPSLGNMIKRLLKLVPALPRLRLSSIDVAEIDADLMDLIANEPRLMPHFHLSLQSGDPMILKRMARRHKPEDVTQFCNEVRKVRPDASFGADIIVGFPTETSAMFENTCELIRHNNIAFLHVFTFSPRHKTPAARMPQVDPKIRKERAQILRNIGEEIVRSHYAAQLKRPSSILIEDSEARLGRSENYSLVKFEPTQTLPSKLNKGDLVTAEITGYQSDSKHGWLLLAKPS